MKIIMRSTLCLAAVLLLAGTARAADGVLIVQKMSIGGAPPQTNQVQIEKNRMRAEIADPSGQKQAIIFDGTKQLIDIVNVDRKTYVELTKEQVDQLGAQMQQMMSQMQGMMANMPPAQRAQMEAMMRGRGGMGGGAAARPEYRKAGTDKVGKWTCDKYEGYQNGQKVMDVCTVEPTALGLSAADVDVMKQLAQFFKAMMPQGATGMIDVSGEQGFSGVPVKSVSTAGGRDVSTEITDVSRQNFADALFQVPAGFQKQDFMPGRGRQ